MIRPMIQTLFASLSLTIAVPAAMSDVLVVRDGLTIDGSNYAGTQSNWLRQDVPATPLANNAIIRVGEQGSGAVRRGVIRFTDLSTRDLGFDAVHVTGARLLLTTDTAFEGAGSVELRVLDTSDSNWIENEVSWTNKATATPWAGGGGAGTNYGSVISTVAWTTILGNPSPVSTQLAFDLTGAALDVVKAWLDGSSLNAGFMLRAADESTAVGPDYIDFYSEDNVSVGESVFPVLEITYTVPEPASAALFGGGVLFAMLRRARVR